MITYELTLSIGFVGATQRELITVKEIGYTDAEWLALSSTERDRILDTEWGNWTENYIDGGAHRMEEEDE